MNEIETSIIVRRGKGEPQIQPGLRFSFSAQARKEHILRTTHRLRFIADATESRCVDAQKATVGLRS